MFFNTKTMRLTNPKDLISDLKYRFADRLREEGVQESFIRDAMMKVSLNDMEKVSFLSKNLNRNLHHNAAVKKNLSKLLINVVQNGLG